MKKIIATFLLLIQMLPAATCRETDKRIVEFADPYILYYDGSITYTEPNIVTASVSWYLKT